MKLNKWVVLGSMSGVGLMIPGFSLYMASMFPLSNLIAERNPDVAFMRIPVLIMIEAVIILFFICMILGEVLLVNIYRRKIFSKQSVQILKAMSWSFFFGILPMVALIIYTNQNVEGSITNLYLYIGIAIYITLGFLFLLFSELIQNAYEFKEELDYTV